MVTINKIKEESCALYFENSQNELIFLGMIENNLEYQDVCLQIAKENSDKYSILFKDKFYKFDRFGNFDCWPYELFNTFEKMCGKIMRLQTGKRKQLKII